MATNQSRPPRQGSISSSQASTPHRPIPGELIPIWWAYYEPLRIGSTFLALLGLAPGMMAIAGGLDDENPLYLAVGVAILPLVVLPLWLSWYIHTHHSRLIFGGDSVQFGLG